MANDPIVPIAETLPLLSRDEVRSKIFATKQAKRKIIDFFGVKIELRQPSLAQAFAEHKGDGESKKLVLIGNLIDCAYIPNTNTKVFDDADYDSLVELPFGEEFGVLAKAIGEITGTNLLITADSSAKNP